VAAREFLDEFALKADDRSRAEAIADRPAVPERSLHRV
jgi:hypothetical protein